MGLGKKEYGVGSWGGEEICLSGRNLIYANFLTRFKG